MAFRLSSWRDQRAAQGDLKIAMESDSSFIAFLSKCLCPEDGGAESLAHEIASARHQGSIKQESLCFSIETNCTIQ